MLGRESKNGSVFSWADEVEREEEAAGGFDQAQAQLQQPRQKPNPFGSARPREIVLQEKGIDWRKLDQQSPSRHGSQNEKLHKQSNSQSETTVFNNKEQNTPPRFGTSPVSSQVISTPQIQSPILVIPPLRYPPKFVAGVLYEQWVSGKENRFHTKHEKEKRFHEERKSQNMKSESAMCGNIRITESVQKGRRNVEDCATRKEGFHCTNSHRLPLANKNIGIGPSQVQNKRVSGKVKQGIGIQNGTAFQVKEKSRTMEDDKWQKITRNAQDYLSVKQVDNNGGRDTDTAHGKIKGDLGRNNNKSFQKKQFKLKTSN
ncbi:Plant specific eukaryotic initiation factor 4B [Corchorus capsularis]|uniref:Plant specific eukaryotic initiation factor 4B n=1 Tax=Corchorus capsularis TaxID=210143 RepID=A0A1R3H0R2_COCAP|nr:Plant specific eukaryotic initiation factor 4B [Corchorus capsularis]